MELTSDIPGMATPGKRWFVIVSAAEPDRILDKFEEVDWGPAIVRYHLKVASGAFKELASLREARPSEI